MNFLIEFCYQYSTAKYIMILIALVLNLLFAFVTAKPDKEYLRRVQEASKQQDGVSLCKTVYPKATGLCTACPCVEELEGFAEALIAIGSCDPLCLNRCYEDWGDSDYYVTTLKLHDDTKVLGFRDKRILMTRAGHILQVIP